MTTGTFDTGTAWIAWERDGAGDTVVLVHGLTEHRGAWGAVRDRLVADHDVVTLDLRGHGESSDADAYDSGSMAADVAAVIVALGLGRPHLVGHSLGGMVATAVASAGLARSVVNIDQPLELASFRTGVRSMEAQIRDPDTFPAVMTALLQQMEGDLLPGDERERLAALRRPRQDVVLDVWQVLLDSTDDDADDGAVGAMIDTMLGECATHGVRYLSILGADAGDGYRAWFAERLAGAETELWPDHGHYPHLVDPDRFVDRMRSFWSA